MKLTVVGTGYVGLVSGTCFAEMGYEVTCVDIDQSKIDQLNQGVIPIYEPGLEDLVIRNTANKNLHFTTELSDSLNDSDVVFIAVGTPSGEDQSADLSYVLHVAQSIGQHMSSPIVIVNKSTVPVGTADKVRSIVQEALDTRGQSFSFSVVSNPEFLKEGDAINDFMKPDRIIIGSDDPEALQLMKQLYRPFFRLNYDRIITMDVRSAEMTKYVSNAMLATKISFMNEIANICERVGADVNLVRIGIGSDSRIGYSFIYPGIGYGGSCFPKDVKALAKTAKDVNYDAVLINAVESVNDYQKKVIATKVVQRFGEDLKGFCFGIWGLSFKPGTDDMREAPSIEVIKALIDKGAHLKVYDPKAMKEAQKHYLSELTSIEYASTKYDAIKDVNAMILMTEWKTFRAPDFDLMKSLMKQTIIFDGRNQFNDIELQKIGFEYYQIGKS